MQNQIEVPKKKRYLISVSPSNANLSNAERKQLLSIIDKQLEEGVKIQLTYTKIKN